MIPSYSPEEVAAAHLPAEWKDRVRWLKRRLKSGEIPMGQYYHDVTGLAAADGHPVRSTFPKEGGVNDAGSWVVSKASDKLEEAHVFIDYMCRPEIQAKLSRQVGTAPTVKLLDAGARVAIRTALAKARPEDPPHIILVPERPFDLETTARGAAMLAALGAGLFGGKNEVADDSDTEYVVAVCRELLMFRAIAEAVRACG